MFNTCGATVPLVANLDNGRSGDGMFGGDGWWAIIIFALIFGWGGNGFGGFGGFGGGREVVNAPCATQADVRAAVDQQTLISKLDQQTYGLADSTYALNNTITNGFHGVDNAVCNLGYNVQTGFNGLSAQLAQCCCDNRAAIADVKYQMATDACDIKHAINDSTRSILDFIVNDKLATLQAENQTLKFQASQAAQNAFIVANQEAQTATLIRRLGADCPVPAYVVPNPNCCYNPFGFNYGNGNNGCGCGC
jgi:hypothetical protein